MELMDGDLRRAIDKDPGGLMHWSRRGKSVALDIARGLTALHACNDIHRDVKSKNVLLIGPLDGPPVAKLADVGVAATLTSGYLSASQTVVGTLAWTAPEMMMGRPCCPKVDVFSFGILLWEMATGGLPRRGFVVMPPPSERCPQELIDLIQACTHETPALRPSAKQLYERILKM